MASKARREDDIHYTQFQTPIKTQEGKDLSETERGLNRALPSTGDDHNTLSFNETVKNKPKAAKQLHIGRPRALHEDGEAELHRRIQEAEKSGLPLTRSECLSIVRSHLIAPKICAPRYIGTL